MTKQTCIDCGRALNPELDQELCAECLLKAGMVQETSDPYAPTFDSGPAQPSDNAFHLTLEEISQLVPHLDIEQELGRGGMGAVYKAKQKSLDRTVALKIINSELLNNATLVDRFAREARALAKLNHPNIVGVHDFGQVNGTCFLVMEFVDGTDLRHLLASDLINPEQALQIVPQICAALQYAHDQGIVHRDIKPENILISQTGQIKIADFGLAKLLSEPGSQDNLTTTRQVMGTLKYMAPEQMEGAASIDHRADIYSLGVVFYELLTGEVPLGRFVAPSERAAVDNRLDGIVMRALERDPPDRYQHASDLQVEVDQFSSNANYEPAEDEPMSYAEPHPDANVVQGPSARRVSEIRTHIRIIAGLNMFFGGLMLVVGAGVFILLTSLGFVSGEREAITVLPMVGGIAAGVMLVLGLPGLLVGFGLWRFRNWARIGALILAALNLFNVPMGTVLAIYTGWALLQDGTNEVFK